MQATWRPAAAPGARAGSTGQALGCDTHAAPAACTSGSTITRDTDVLAA
jgi:hypothetical protein